VVNDNNALQIKLDNLEQLFIKSSTNGKKALNEEYMNSNLMAENKLIKEKIEEAEDDIFNIQEKLRMSSVENTKERQEFRELKSLNRNLAERIEFLQRR
jgi:kinesin family protein 12